MEKLTLKLWLVIAVATCAFHRTESTSLRLRQALLSSGSYLNDVDGDNIPGRAGIDYPVYASVPKDTSFRCRDYDYAGYFADVEADCQAYHVCFPDGRNASFLCVNGTVFHQRYFVCDWWFHSNCSLAPTLFDLNLFRKIPLPVLPPVQRRPFPGPAPQPGPAPPPSPPRNELTPPSSPRARPSPPSTRGGPSPPSPRGGPSPLSPITSPSPPPPGSGPSPPSTRGRPSPPSTRGGPPSQLPKENPREPKTMRPNPTDKETIQPKKMKDSNDLTVPAPDYDRKPGNKKPLPPRGDKHDEKCICQCGSSPAAMYISSAVQYDDEHS